MNSPLAEAARRALMPRPVIRTLDWAREHVQTADGRPYDHAAYPHLGAPGGPMDALDCSQYSTIWLQWASRLGKTFFGQCALMKFAACDPGPMMFASADQKLAVEVTARTYRMLEKSPALRDQLRPPHRRKQDFIELRECRCFVAWARSVSTLADKAVRIGHANEIDKWEHLSTSKEADPLKLFTDRFKEFPTHKKILESTPAIKSTSRIERGRLGSTNCSFYAPCFQCGEYQRLEMANLKWDKHANGKSDRDTARRSARYVCPLCQFEHADEHRAPTIRLGVWVPEGCEVDKDWAKECATDWKGGSRPLWRGWSESPWITGTPLRDARDAGYQLSSLYALSLGWGDIAAEFVESQRNPQNLRNFVNQWLGETWETIKQQTTWEQLGQKLISPDIYRAIVPKWASVITIGCDRQGDDRHPWVCDAWGPGRCATIAYGEAESIEDFELNVALAAWQHEDGGQPLFAEMVLIDSGHRPVNVYELCERLQMAGIPALACKGSASLLPSEYNVDTLGKNTSRPGTAICHVDTIRSQSWIESSLHDADPADENGFQIFGGSLGDHQDFLQQMLNDAPVQKVDSHNNTRESWDRIDDGIPNDFRDCKRYAWIAKLLVERRTPIRPRRTTVVKAAPQENSRVRELRIRR